MSSLVGLGVGLLLGMWSAWSLRRQMRLIVERNERATVHPFVYRWLVRLVIAVATLAVLIGWSPAAALVAIVGYWLSRTVFLVGARDFI